MIRPIVLYCFAALSLLDARSQSLNTQSPFMSAGGADTNAPQSTAYELVGIIAGSKQTMVGITDKTSKRSFWIQVGKMSDGVEVVSCDPQKDRAVIRVGGQTQSLAMHAASVASAPASMVNISPAPASGVRPTAAQAQVQADQEREARMLVSDLLEISIQQRKAYEESQKKSAGTSAGAAAPTNPSAPRR